MCGECAPSGTTDDALRSSELLIWRRAGFQRCSKCFDLFYEHIICEYNIVIDKGDR